MEDFTVEKANHIIHYYATLLTQDEKKALAYYMVTLKHADDAERIEMYLQKGRITNDPEVLKYLSGGYQQFVINCAKRILTTMPEKVFFNLCPKCEKLARTPLAKQCRFCGFNWH